MLCFFTARLENFMSVSQVSQASWIDVVGCYGKKKNFDGSYMDPVSFFMIAKWFLSGVILLTLELEKAMRGILNPLA